MVGSRRSLRVLHIEDNDDDAQIVLRELRRGGFDPTLHRVYAAADLASALDQSWDVVLCDYELPGFSAPAALAQVRARTDLPFILVSGTIGEEAAVEMMRAGAGDFVLKDRLGRLVPAIERELRDAATRAELRHADEVMRRTEKLRSLGQLSLGIAHDLKNVLNPMSLYLAQIERALERAGARTEPVGKLRDALHHGVQTIDRLRSFGRLEPEAIPVRFELADAAREALALAAPKRDAHTGVELGDLIGDPGTVTGSRNEVVDAVLNLIVNAIDACPHGGRIVVEASRDARWAFVTVSDDGTGMTPEIEARVFEPFFTTRGESGTGLGLANVFATMRRHGGHVDLETALGCGSKFTLRFPR
jgi:signal transduction histidine kinase